MKVAVINLDLLMTILTVGCAPDLSSCEVWCFCQLLWWAQDR